MNAACPKKAERKEYFVTACCLRAERQLGIEHIGSLEGSAEQLKVIQRASGLSDEFLQQVRDAAPPRPYTREIVESTARKLRCTVRDVYAAISYISAETRQKSWLRHLGKGKAITVPDKLRVDGQLEDVTPGTGEGSEE